VRHLDRNPGGACCSICFVSRTRRSPARRTCVGRSAPRFCGVRRSCRIGLVSETFRRRPRAFGTHSTLRSPAYERRRTAHHSTAREDEMLAAPLTWYSEDASVHGCSRTPFIAYRYRASPAWAFATDGRHFAVHRSRVGVSLPAPPRSRRRQLGLRPQPAAPTLRIGRRAPRRRRSP